MYLRDCLIQDVGPIRNLRVKPRFTDDGLPVPLILVGTNGSGKTTILAHVADALIELAKTAFNDVVAGQQLGTSPYFKVTGPSNQRSGSPFGLALLTAANGSDIFRYADKTGRLDPSTYDAGVRSEYQAVFSWPIEGNHKKVFGDAKAVERAFAANAVCFFPSGRSEDPHWLNERNIVAPKYDGLERRFAGQLKKPLFIERCRTENSVWITDVISDSFVDLEPDPTGSGRLRPKADFPARLLLKQVRDNLDTVLRHVLQDPSAHLQLRHRQTGARLVVQRADRLIPGLDHLSAGETILFNMFATLLRYAEPQILMKPMPITPEIEGIAIIDEVDAHLHTALQSVALPALIKMFPKVQFILSTHAPVFILGMQREFGAAGFDVFDLGEGARITIDRFSEFHRSLECYAATAEFDAAIATRMASAQKAIVLTEGETDPLYIRCALEILPGGSELLEKIDVEWVGALRNGQAFNTGDGGLNHTRNVCEANPQLVTRPVILLYDSDTKKAAEDIGRLHIRCLPANPKNTVVRKGIENLLSQDLLTDRRFYKSATTVGDYGEQRTIESFDKMAFCRWVCRERKDPADFAEFAPILDLLSSTLATP